MNNDNDSNNFNNSVNNDNPLDNGNYIRHVNNARNTVLKLGDSIVKKWNGYLVIKKSGDRKLITVRSFGTSKVSYIYDHVKPTIWEFNLNDIILHELKSSKTACQISMPVTDLALSSKHKKKNKKKNCIDITKY